MSVDTALDSEKSYVFICPNATDRKIIHTYMEQVHRRYDKISVHVAGFPSDEKMYKSCYRCKKSVLMTYKRGIMPNNIDEYYSGICDCGITASYEPNYDSLDGIRTSKGHNAIVFSSGINVRHGGGDCGGTPVSKDEFFKIMSNMQMFTLDIPCDIRGSLGRRKRGKLQQKRRVLERRIDECIKIELSALMKTCQKT